MTTTSAATRRLATFLGAAMVLTLAPAGSAIAAGSFWDDDDNVHEQDIEGLAAAEVTKGCDPPANSQYCTFDGVERGQMAAFLTRALDLPEPSQDYFDDDEDSIFEDDINRIAEAGITTGCNPPENDEYCPTDFVRRDQMAKFLANGYDVPSSDEDAFDDDDGNIFEQQINGIEDAGITLGCNPPENDRYCPDDVVRRNEMASFITRADDDIDPIDPQSLHERQVSYTVNGYLGGEGDVDIRWTDLLRRRAKEGLYAAEGWNIQHRLLVEEVEGEGDFSLILTPADQMDDANEDCSADEPVCTVDDVVYVNLEDFQERPATWADRSQAEFQRYIVQHGVGHFLDFDQTTDADDPTHYNDEIYCSSDGEAPVMRQQWEDTTTTCTTNVYPLPFERDCVEEAWIADETNQGNGDGDIDDQCPHAPNER